MNRVPDNVETRFYDFCWSCPLCKLDTCIQGTHFDEEILETKNFLTCEHYGFCGAFVKAAREGKIRP